MRAAAWLALAAALAACDDAPAGDCAAGDDAAVACDPLFTPELAEIQARVFTPSCAVAGGACHAPEGRAGGLDLSSLDATRAALASRVEPGSPECSLLVQRIDATGPSVMPPGAPLPAAARCAIRQWIHAGAAP
ncbi:MAG: hypothetical protein H6706_10790 [Myxococcales bacterium]|nr:hypothetical protein [Myxococcales bacterium]